MKSLKKLLLFVLLLTFVSNTYAQVFVKHDATGSNDGTSWANAYTSLQSALDNSSSWGGTIWVAAGTYKPSTSPSLCQSCWSDRNFTFFIPSNVNIYGGFAGTETNLSQRNIVANPTILSGDIGVVGDDSDNCYSVILLFSGTMLQSNNVIIDGFTVQHGNSSGNGTIGIGFFDYFSGGFIGDNISDLGSGLTIQNCSPILSNLTVSNNATRAIYINNASPYLNTVTVSNNQAEGIYNDYSTPTLTDVIASYNQGIGINNYYSDINVVGGSVSYNVGPGIVNNYSSPILSNLTISNNYNNATYGYTAGIVNQYSSPVLTNVTISNNNSGGMQNHMYSSPILTNVTVSNNNGIGIYNLTHSSPTLTNVVLSNNTNNTSTGQGGGMYIQNYSNPILNNVLIVNNTAKKGAGLYINHESHPILTNVTIANNTASDVADGLYIGQLSNPNIRNSVIWDNGSSDIYNIFVTNPTFSHSIVKGSGGSSAWVNTYGTDNGNNLDVNPLFVNAASGDFRLQAGSPAINVGSNGFNTIATDLAGNSRIQNGTIDMGAYEGGVISLLISSTTSNVSCFGANNGTINLTVAGGTAPYTYIWNDSNTSQNRTNLTAGTYTVTVTDANGTTSSHQAIVTQPTAITIAHTATRPCNGTSNGTITLNVTGGTTPYTYLWNDGNTSQNRTNLNAGVYRVTVTDANSCTKTKAITIVSSTALVITPTVINVSCYGGNNGRINLTVTGGTSPYTYAWSGSSSTSRNRTNLTAGTYNVTVTDANGCTAISTFTVTQPSQIAVTKTVVNTTNGNNNGSITLNVTGGTAPYTYLWNNSSTTPTITGLGINTYRVTITDATGCTRVINSIVNRPAGNGNGNETEELFEEQLSKLYPNPATNFFNVTLESDNSQEVQINVFSSLGILVYSETTSQANTSIATENWASGVYRVQVRTKEKVQTHSVIIQR